MKFFFFSGIRVGELLALCPKDIDQKKNLIHINKTYHRVNCTDIISLPKTKKSKRDVSIPKRLTEKIITYINSHKESISISNRLFSFSSAALRYSIRKYAPIADVPVIRIHDLRHSHVSLLVNMGFNVSLIADRLGHEKIQTTLDIYTHLNQRERNKVSEQLEEIIVKNETSEEEEIVEEEYIQEQVG